MMIPERPALEKRLLSALDGEQPRIPVLVGGCGSGRTSLLLRLRDLIGRTDAQYIGVERIATTPERFLMSMRQATPFTGHQHGTGGELGPREAFDASLAFLDTARGAGGAPVTFLLDEFLELRTFESFPGLRSVLRDMVGALAASGNRFVLSTRFIARAHRLLRDAPAVFELVHLAPLSAAEVRATLAGSASDHGEDDDPRRDDLARMVHALSGGRPAYARMIAEASAAMASRGGADPVGALASLLAPGGALAASCRFGYELRLHRARGYGALKAILDVLADEEPLTLTEIAQRLRRTPGSTKDYLSWLEDVDLIVSRRKRYSFADPMLRLWVRLHCRATHPTEEDIAHEVHTYVLANLPSDEAALAVAGSPADRVPDTDKSWGIIEID